MWRKFLSPMPTSVSFLASLKFKMYYTLNNFTFYLAFWAQSANFGWHVIIWTLFLTFNRLIISLNLWSLLIVQKIINYNLIIINFILLKLSANICIENLKVLRGALIWNQVSYLSPLLFWVLRPQHLIKKSQKIFFVQNLCEFNFGHSY